LTFTKYRKCLILISFLIGVDLHLTRKVGGLAVNVKINRWAKWGPWAVLSLALVLGTSSQAALAASGKREAKAHSATHSVARGKAVKSASAQSGTRKPIKVKASKGNKTEVIRHAKDGHRAKVLGKHNVTRVKYIAPPPPKMSFGALAGLHDVGDPLDLRSSVAYVLDQETREVLLRKNESAVLPIASLTKLMTGLLISESRLPLDEEVTITEADVDTEKGSRSRLVVGTTLLRGELLHLALMSSENRAAHALGRTYPGGMSAFVANMNARARSLGMRDTRYVEPTGLSSSNQSTAQDLAILVAATSRDPLLRELTTSPTYTAMVGNRPTQFNTTNALVKNPDWEIGVQKTGYISEAGQCLVMQAKIAGRKLIMVFLDSTGRRSRVADAQRVKRWVEANSVGSLQLQSKALTGGDQNSAL
jgi:D-alanyl-D-alanine endopeptidase (penicillin-binding protein 7)